MPRKLVFSVLLFSIQCLLKRSNKWLEKFARLIFFSEMPSWVYLATLIPVEVIKMWGRRFVDELLRMHFVVWKGTVVVKEGRPVFNKFYENIKTCRIRLSSQLKRKERVLCIIIVDARYRRIKWCGCVGSRGLGLSLHIFVRKNDYVKEIALSAC